MKSDLFLEWRWTIFSPLSRIWAIMSTYFYVIPNIFFFKDWKCCYFSKVIWIFLLKRLIFTKKLTLYYLQKDTLRPNISVWIWTYTSNQIWRTCLLEDNTFIRTITQLHLIIATTTYHYFLKLKCYMPD